jgi:mRNA interferase MazF
MERGDVYDARLGPVEGSEQAGTRPVIIVSRNAINARLTVVTVVPCTTHRPNVRVYPSRAAIQAPDGGLTVDSVVLCEQARAVSKARLLRYRGTLSARAMAAVDRALRIALDL